MTAKKPKPAKRPWAELEKDFTALAKEWAPIGTVQGRVYWTACINFIQICHEADIGNYSNPSLLKGARLMKRIAAKYLPPRKTGKKDKP